MKLETFLEKFDQFADAPDAVAKMRELILGLAVQGKLSPQNDSDEGAENLIKRATELASKLPNAAKYQRIAKVANDHLVTTELPLLPRGWVWTCSVVIGDTAPRVDAPDDAQVAFAPMNLLPTDYRSTFKPEVRAWREIKKGYTHFADGDVAFAKITPCFQNGKGCVFSDLPGGIGAGTTELHVLRPFKGVVLPLYALLFYKSPEFVSGGVASFSGTAGQQRVSNDYFRFAPFPLPPLAEQKRIVAKVDVLMALCDRLEAQQQERDTRHAALARASLARFADAPTPANLNFLFQKSYDIAPADLRKSILTLAVQGKLVPQDPNDEPAEVLLKRSLAERRKLKRTDAAEVQPLAAEDALGYDIPESWRWQRLDDLLVFGPTNGFSPKAVDYETPVRSLTLSATTSGRFKGQHSKFITTEVPADSDLWLRDGDILVQRGNTIEYVGVAAVYRGEPNCFVYPDLMMKLRVSAAFDVGYIHLAMSHDASRDFLRARASGTSGSMPKINQTTLKSLPLPIPPLAEQRRIVAKVQQLMALVDALETQLAASRATAAKLTEALVAELAHGN